MSCSEKLPTFRCTYHRSDKPRDKKTSTSDQQKIAAAATRLSKSFEGRQLLRAAAKLESDDLRALADFATAASKGMW